MNIRNIIAENKLVDFGKIEPKEDVEEEHEETIESFQKPLLQDQTITDAENLDTEDLQITEPRFKKRKLLVIILVLATISAGVYYAIPMSTVIEDATDTENVIKEPPQPPKFIDAAEPENKALKEDAEAKKKHVNVFEFDINNCLQTYSDEECMNLFDKNLQISE